MILPMSVTSTPRRGMGWRPGTTRFKSGKATKSTPATAPSAAQPFAPYRRENVEEIGPI